MARTNRSNEAYHIPTLNVWFAVAALVLLVTSVWMIYFDYARPWKDVQRHFRAIERVRLATERDLAKKAEDQQAITTLEKQLATAREHLASKAADIHSQRAAVVHLEQDEYYVAKQTYNFARASLGALRYATEQYAEHHPDDAAGNQARLAHYRCEVYRIDGGEEAVDCPPRLDNNGDSLKETFRKKDDALAQARIAFDALLAERKEIEGEITAAQAQMKSAQKRLDKIAPGFFNDDFRDAPLVDFMVPSLKIKQVVLRDIRDDYNFASVQKEDRCMTCHLGIDQKSYEIDPTTGRFAELATRMTMERGLASALASFVDARVPAAERSEYKEEVAAFIEEGKLTVDQWLRDNFEACDTEDENGKPAPVSCPAKDAVAAAVEDLRLQTVTFGAHPKPELFMTSSSPHPMDAYGCTVCHEGRGHATDFNRAYHTPDNEAERARWEARYGWETPHYWDYPQLSSSRVVASCAKCHDAERKLAGAGQLNRGKYLVEKFGCFGCHRIEGMTGERRKVGPTLVHLPAKISREFAWSWIWDPKYFRPLTKMPRFFGQSNNSLHKWKARGRQEVRGIVAYLFAKAQPFAKQQPPRKGNPVAGEKTFEKVGCLGCHTLGEKHQTANDYGPDLTGLGTKLAPEWVYTWVKNPRAYFPKTHMPSLRLSDQEASNVVAYLLTLKKDPSWKPHPMPSRDEALQKNLLEEYLDTSMRHSEIATLFADTNADDLELLLGEKAIGKYGCFGCHEIPGFEKTGGIGSELSLWGDKFLSQLDFALISHHGEHKEVDHTKIAWATHKLHNPRFWDRGKEKTKAYKELLRMPYFGFTDEEVHALVTFLLSRRRQEVVVTKRPVRTPQYEAVQAGRHLVRKYNCHGCHYFDGEGGRFAQYWQVDTTSGEPFFRTAAGKPGFNYLRDVPGPVRGHVPPLLLDQGNKTRPEWLFGFLRDPSNKLRPRLRMRMPTFQFTDTEDNQLVRMFAGLEGRTVGDQLTFSTDPQLAVLGQELFSRGKCTQCHVFSDRMPKVVPRAAVAPNLKLVTSRLQESWTPRWLKDPQSIMPGANMPNYFDFAEHTTVLDVDGKLLDGDFQKGMDALNHYLIISGRTYAGPKTARR